MRLSPEVSGQDVGAKKNRVEFQRSRTSLFALSISKGHSVLVDPLGLPENRSSFGTGVLAKCHQTKKEHFRTPFVVDPLGLEPRLF